jgi:hypothetical protein
MLKQVQHDGVESLKGPNVSVALLSRGALRRAQALPAAQGYGNVSKPVPTDRLPMPGEAV